MKVKKLEWDETLGTDFHFHSTQCGSFKANISVSLKTGNVLIFLLTEQFHNKVTNLAEGKEFVQNWFNNWVTNTYLED